MATSRFTRSNFLPSGLSDVMEKMSSKSVTRADVAAAIIFLNYVMFILSFVE